MLLLRLQSFHSFAFWSDEARRRITMHIIISPFDDGSICMKMRKSLSYPSFVHRTRHLNMTVWLCSQRANFYNTASTATICQKMANPTFLCKLRRFSKTFFRFLKVYLFSLCSVVTIFFFLKKKTLDMASHQKLGSGQCRKRQHCYKLQFLPHEK